MRENVWVVGAFVAWLEGFVGVSRGREGAGGRNESAGHLEGGGRGVKAGQVMVSHGLMAAAVCALGDTNIFVCPYPIEYVEALVRLGLHMW